MLTSRQYEQLGREVFSRNPEYAREIIGEVSIFPDIKDLNKVPDVFKRFCEIQRVTNGHLDFKSKKVRNSKKLFLMVMILCFQAEARNPDIRIRHGLYTRAAQSLGNSISVTRKHANNARSEYQIYKDFRKEVDELYTLIIRDYAT